MISMAGSRIKAITSGQNFSIVESMRDYENSHVWSRVGH